MAAIRAIVLQAVLGGAGAAAGIYSGFRLFLPSEPHCGLAILPAMFFGGGLGGLVGFALGLAMATILKESFRRPG